MSRDFDLAGQLAATAHEAWCRQLLAQGWTPGAEYDEAAKVHDALLPFEGLAWHEKKALVQVMRFEKVEEWLATLVDPRFDATLAQLGHTGHMLSRLSPNLNARCERFIQTLGQECLDRFIVLGLKHLDHLVAEFTSYYNRERPHSALEFRAPAAAFQSARPPPPLVDQHTLKAGQIRCKRRLGGLVKSYSRAA